MHIVDSPVLLVPTTATFDFLDYLYMAGFSFVSGYV